MRGNFGSYARRGLALTWSAATIVYLAVVSAAVIHDANFQLNVGIIKMTGRMALLPILFPAVAGLVGFVLVLWRVRWGDWLLGAYSIFCGGILAAALPLIWNAKTSFCTGTMCISTPWIGRLLLTSIATCFFLAAWWAYLDARHNRVTTSLH